MRGFAATLACALLFTAGCAGPESTDANVQDAGTSGADASSLLEPTVVDWTGHIVTSELEAQTHHTRPEEDVVWPVSQAGILFSVDEMPQAMEVALDWVGPGNFKIMLHSHKAHGTNVYVEHVTAFDPENPKCLRVPAADLAEGAWQVMVHSRGARQTDFTLRIGLWGGAGHILEDERHGHLPQDGAFEVDDHTIEPCQMLMVPEDDSTAPTVVPAEAHFEFGESLGCDRLTSAGPTCIEFHAGPGGTGRGVDGHWIRLDPSYWGLNLTSTIDQPSGANDSDCVFTDVNGIMVGETGVPRGPCTGLVPKYAEWVFVHPYLAPALGITVDFVLPPTA